MFGGPTPWLAAALLAGSLAALPADTAVEAQQPCVTFRDVEVVCIREGYQCQYSACYCYYVLGEEMFCEH